MRRLSVLLFLLVLSMSSMGQDMQLKLPISHATIDVRAAYSKNNQLLLTREHRTAILWDADTYRPLREYTEVTDCSFSYDNNFIIVTRDNAIQIYEVSTNQLVFTVLKGGSFSIYNPILSRDSRILYYTKIVSNSWKYESEMVAVEIDSHKTLYTKSFGESASYGYPLLSLDPSGKLLAICGFWTKSVVVNSTSGEELYSIPADTVKYLEFSDDGKLLLAVLPNGISVMNAATGKLYRSVGRSSDQFTHASFSHDSKKLVTSSLDNNIRIWNAGSGTMIKEFKTKGPVYKTFFTAKDNYLLSALDYNWVAIREVSTGEVINDGFSFYAYFGGPNQASFDEKLVYMGGKIVKLSNGEELIEFEQPLGEIKTTALTSDGRYFAFVSEMNNVGVWDLNTAKLVSDFSMPDTARFSNWITTVAFSDNKTLLVGWSNGETWQWDCEGSQLKKIIKDHPQIRTYVFNEAKDKVLVVSDSAASVFETATLKKVFSFIKDSMYLFASSASFSPDQTKIILNGKRKAYVLDASTGKVLSTVPNTEDARTALITPDNKRIVFIPDASEAFVYDLQTARQLTVLKNIWGHEFHGAGAQLGGDSSVFVSSVSYTSDVKLWTIQKWDLFSGELLLKVDGIGFDKFDGTDDFVLTQLDDSLVYRGADLKPVQTVEAKRFLMDTANRRIFVSDRFTTNIYSYDFKKQLTLVSLGVQNSSFKYTSLGAIAILPNNYYKADRNTISRLHFIKGLQVIGVNQLDIKLNRPDKVLAALNSRDTVLISAYKGAYEKRLSKAGINATLLTGELMLPEADIRNRQSIPLEQTGSSITIEVVGSDPRANLDHYNLWVNDVPLYGAAGVSVKNKNAKKIQEKITIALSKGLNQIEFSVTNVNGIESFRKPLQVYQGSLKKASEVGGYESYDANKPRDKIFFIGIGIDKFKDSKHNLAWSVKDITDLSEEIKEKNGSSDVYVHTLFNEQVTVENIALLKNVLSKAGVNDKVIISYSGHGLLSKDLEYYLSTYNVNFEKPEEGGIAYKNFESLLDGIAPRMKLLLIDACHSGEVDKEELAKYQFLEKSLADSGTKSSRKPVLNDGNAGMKTSFELMQEMFTNVGASTGATIISAAGGTQFAQERNDLQNGVFTYSILEYMKEHNSATVSELKNYVNKRVSEITKGLQVPTTRSETKAVDWRVW